MQKIIYYVASSLDGYISGLNDDVSMFLPSGDGVKRYLSDLQDFKTVIMGRKTYEFGYQYGMIPGQPAYPHMEHFIFSDSLELENKAKNVHIEKMSLDRIKEIRDQSETNVYLCGGGQFAGWLLENDMINELKIKLNPIILGGGVRLFGDAQKVVSWKLKESKEYDGGLQIMSFIK